MHRRDELRASKIMQERALSNNKIEWALNKTPLEIIAGDNGVTGLKVQNNITGKEEIIPANGVFVAIGHHPNTDFLDGQITTHVDLSGVILHTDQGFQSGGLHACD